MQGNQVVATIANDRLKIVVGMGTTGWSVARFLAASGQRFAVVDTREQPPTLERFRQAFPNVELELGELQAETLMLADEVFVSPGISLQHPALQEVAGAGIRMTGDIDLFASAATAPIVAITGSNGKSTVTTLFGQMCQDAGKVVAVGGNLGTPALDLLSDDCELYVLELSSFQLELASQLNAAVAVVLNVSPDHMDRYASISQYHAAKHRVFFGAKQVVVNRDDPLSTPLVPDQVKRWSFGLSAPDFHGFGIKERDGECWLVFQFEWLMPASEVVIKGRHNLANVLAALALGEAVGLPRQGMLDTVRKFCGLSHRCQTVARYQNVDFINDSKATNVGATLAAIAGLAGERNIILIAGGQGKGQDFSLLGKSLDGAVRQVILMGEDAALLAKAVGDAAEVTYATSMEQAVALAAENAVAGDIVLLSPACASFDMFAGFEDRGEKFVAAVEALA